MEEDMEMIDEMVAEVRNKAKVVQARGKNYPNDPSMRKMYREDAKDLRKGANLIKRGKFAEAFEVFDYMDTAAREEVPDSAWDFCRNEYYRINA
jgi:Flp pilus assembly protein TadD